MGKNRDRASRQGNTSEMQAFQPVSLFASARDRVRVARTGVGQAAVEVDGAVGPGEAHGLAGGGAQGGGEPSDHASVATSKHRTSFRRAENGV